MGDIINPVTILLHMANTLLLFLALYFLLYKPVRKFMKKRSEEIQQTIDNADQKEQQATELVEQARQQAKETECAAKEAGVESAKRAQERAEQIVASANADAERLLDEAKAEAVAILKEADTAIVDRAAELAVEMAETLLRREVTESDHQALVEDFMKKVTADD